MAEELRKEGTGKSHVTHSPPERWSIDGRRSASLPASRWLAGIRKPAPQLRPRAGDVEAARRIPPSLVEALKSVGVFRMAMPRSHGGLELDLPAVLEIITALSKIDGSLGWTTAIASGGDLYAPLLPRDTYDEVYRPGADVVLAGSSQPAGTAEATAGRWGDGGRSRADASTPIGWPECASCPIAESRCSTRRERRWSEVSSCRRVTG